MVGKSERNSADHAAVVAEIEMAADQPGMASQRRLRNGAETERLRGQHEITDIGAAIDRAVDPERLGRMDDRDMRRAEEIVVLKRLPGIGRLVAPGDAERVVELEAAFAAAFEVNAEIFAREWKVAVFRRAGACLGVDRLT